MTAPPDGAPAAQRVVHLSDLHIAETDVSRRVLGQLPVALAACARELAGPPVAAVFLTGDLFDTSDYDVRSAIERFTALYAAIMSALPAPVPVVVLPGNHDRRKAGAYGDHDPTLFRALAAAVAATSPPVFVAGLARSRAEGVPLALHGMHAHVATYDSTVLLSGFFSAGGEIRQEDLLWLIASLDRAEHPDRPLFLLTHHHVIPTPVTDVGRVQTQGRGALTRWLVRRVLPRLVSNADHEELTMTALGAGTALSTLHGVGRPVVVLHGHKHYPAARLVVGTEPHENDVVILSAGSAGVAEAWAPTGNHDTGHLWPSFNVIDFGPRGALAAHRVAFSERDGRLAPPSPLLRAQRHGLRWRLVPSPEPAPAPPELARNEARFTLTDAGNRWNLGCTRVLVAGAAGETSQVEVVEGAPGSTATDIDDGGAPSTRALPFRLAVGTARRSSYLLQNGLCRTASEAERVYGRGSTFEWVGLVNRVPASEALLHLDGLPEDVDAFASVTDMITGRQTVVPLERRADGGRRVSVRPCAARQLLRIYLVL